MTTPGDLITLVVRAHEVLHRVVTDTDGFLRSAGLVDGSLEIVAALTVVCITWLVAAIALGGVWRVSRGAIRRSREWRSDESDQAAPERMQ